jgi:hypothetical protein
MLIITSPRGNLPGLPGNWDASPGIPVKTCDKKERNKNKCTSDAGHVGAAERKWEF